MESKSVLALIVLIMATVGFSMAPTMSSPAGTASSAPAPIGGSLAGPAVALAAPTISHDVSTFPRTVLVEAFTAEWCEWCPEESHAMYTLEHQFSRSALVVGELHVCYDGPSDCGDSFNTPDGISLTRQEYYDVSGIPTVAIDGKVIAGSNANETMLYDTYLSALENASSVPGGVQINQSAEFTSLGNVTVSEQVTSGVTGTFHALSYLVEYIGQNISGGGGIHDIDYVVRAAIVNENVNLVAGSSIALSGTTEMVPGWNQDNLSVISFIQNNSTMDVENSNMVPVVNLAGSLSANPGTISVGESVQVTVQATNTTTGAPVEGAQVALQSSDGGTFGSPVGTTAADGSFQTTFAVPYVTALTTDNLTAVISSPGYATTTAATTLVINPTSPPSVPLGVNIVPSGQDQVDLAWASPATGGNGVTYHVFRSTAPSVGFQLVSTGTSTSFDDPNVVAGTNYYYIVDGENNGGWGVNTTEIVANSVSVEPEGLPAGVGWTLTIDSTELNSTTGSALTFYLPNGDFSYSFSAWKYEFIAAETGQSLSLSSAPQTLTAAFAYRLATLELAVQPASATVTLNGTAVPLSASGDATLSLKAGWDLIQVSAAGFVTTSKNESFTWGNTSTVTIQLTASSPSHPNQGSSGASTTIAGLVPWEFGTILVGILLVAGVAILLARRRPGGPASPPSS